MKHHLTVLKPSNQLLVSVVGRQLDKNAGSVLLGLRGGGAVSIDCQIDEHVPGTFQLVNIYRAR
jgi:hypothetical protein